MNVNEICRLIKEVAAQEILPRFRNLKETEVHYKEPGEFVTAADLASEEALRKGLLSLYPDSVVTGEEDIAENPERLGELFKADCGFLIDPIDGTNNFIRGNERFAVMIVALAQVKVTASWIYLPAKDIMTHAIKGEGAFINDEKITLSVPKTELSDLIGAAHINRMPREIKEDTKEKLRVIKENRPGFCAGYDYVSLVSGKKDFSVYCRTLIWDHLPGSLIYQEAGGYALGLDGQPYTPKTGGKGLLCASNEEMWHKINNEIFA